METINWKSTKIYIFPAKSTIDANAILIFVYMKYNNVDSMID